MNYNFSWVTPWRWRDEVGSALSNEKYVLMAQPRGYLTSPRSSHN